MTPQRFCDDPLMRSLVTGCAGFIGSTLAEALLEAGHEVIGIDCFTPYYDSTRKRHNLLSALAHDRFEFVERDLRTADLVELMSDVDTIFHQAAQPGVRLSWSSGFAEYDSHNVLATQRLLDAAAHSTSLQRLVYASSSSVYGNAASYPTHEDVLPRPHSPYGVTKLAAEHLCSLYAENYDVPAVSLRYFTVYGPRQRPDMAIGRLVAAALEGATFTLYGDGEQIRDFTFVDDVVAANLAAASADVAPGFFCNVAGGASTTMNRLIDVITEVTANQLRVVRGAPQPGDVKETGGTIDRARKALQWEPRTTLQEGIRRHAAWYRGERGGARIGR